MARHRISLIEIGLTGHYYRGNLTAFIEVLMTFAYEQRQEIRQRCIREYDRPGGGVFTMDFCTLGMFIIGGFVRTIILHV